jgi:hypothetical protein
VGGGTSNRLFSSAGPLRSRPVTTSYDHLKPLWDTTAELVRAGAQPSPETRRRLWTAAGLPDGQPARGMFAVRRNKRAVEWLDEAFRMTAMTSDEAGRSGEFYDRLHAEVDMLEDAKFALRSALGMAPW